MKEFVGDGRICLGVSSCLLGHPVRFDGNHKRDDYVNDELARYFTFMPICPEIGIGLTTPREPIRLVGTNGHERAVGTKNPHRDVTAALRAFAEKVSHHLDSISGYIFKKGSPSCGMERVKVYRADGYAENRGTGIYAREIMARFPALPVEEEGRLIDPVLRENFIERVYVYSRWQKFAAQGISAAGLVRFHTEHKYIVLTRGQMRIRELGRLVAVAGRGDIRVIADAYLRGLMTVLKTPATRGANANVIMHLLGYLKRRLDPAEKSELVQLIDDYRLGRVPLVVPITMLKHHLRRHPASYVQKQHFIDPYPPEMRLRNDI